MDKITIPKGDEGFTLGFTVKDANGTVVNLTTPYTAVTIKMWVSGAPETLLLNKACASAASDGTCSYTIDEDDFTDKTYPPAGSYYAELELTGTDIVESTGKFEITILESG